MMENNKVDNDFKIMRLALLKSGKIAKSLREAYPVADGIISLWNRE
jgi:hypothetical protein